MRIELTAPAKKQLETLSDKQKMTQVSLMSHMVEWMTSQDKLLQAEVLGRYPDDIRKDVAKLILKRLA